MAEQNRQPRLEVEAAPAPRTGNQGAQKQGSEKQRVGKQDHGKQASSKQGTSQGATKRRPSRQGASKRGTVASPYLTPAYQLLSKGIAETLGTKTAKAFSKVGVMTLADLLNYTPRHYLSGTERSNLSQLIPDERAAVMAEVGLTSSSTFKGNPYRYRLEADLTDGDGHLRLIFFGKKYLVDYWEHALHQGEQGIFVGKISEFRDELQMTHPDFVMLDAHGRIVGAADEKRATMAKVVTRSNLIGIYPAKASLPTWEIAECVEMALTLVERMDDPLPEEIRQRYALPLLQQALDMVHRPESLEQVQLGMRRLKFDEALSLQLAMVYRRQEAASHQSVAITHRPGGLVDALDARLPFELTAGQLEVAREIADDMAGQVPMKRLLQGEVGSGKTVVALRAMLSAVDNGMQAVLLAPTEVLASQHAASIADMMGPLAQAGALDAPEQATQIALLTGSVTGKRRTEVMEKITSGQAGIVIGTHALLAEGVNLHHPGLVVIDEQHRFGVEQRAQLTADAGHYPHELVLTATPIPRSVAMTVFGDLAVSTLHEVPRGRASVQTTVVLTQVHPGWLPRVWQRVREEVAQGRQAFIICPRIGDDPQESADENAIAGAVETYQRLNEHELAGLNLGLLHGRMPGAQKNEIMQAYASGTIDVLVTTTVIEVGVDVPNASAMVVLDADRFGVSQLHQLRGRIGRGEHPGICLLISGVDARTPAATRLADVASTRDGFQLAELDLEQRREGDVLGTEQSGGKRSLRLLSVLNDAEVIQDARDCAEQICQAPPDQLEPGLHDMLTDATLMSAQEWLDRD